MPTCQLYVDLFLIFFFIFQLWGPIYCHFFSKRRKIYAIWRETRVLFTAISNKCYRIPNIEYKEM